MNCSMCGRPGVYATGLQTGRPFCRDCYGQPGGGSDERAAVLVAGHHAAVARCRAMWAEGKSVSDMMKIYPAAGRSSIEHWVFGIHMGKLGDDWCAGKDCGEANGEVTVSWCSAPVNDVHPTLAPGHARRAIAAGWRPSPDQEVPPELRALLDEAARSRS